MSRPPHDPLWPSGPPADVSLDATIDATDGPAPEPPPEPDALLTAEHPGRYVMRGTLGEGGIGYVDRVFDRHLGREVAIKTLKPDIARRPDRQLVERRFQTEARITALLEHPGIVPVHELGRRADGTVYYAMKQIRGRTLRAALEGADLPARLALLPRYVALCQAMAYAHSRGVIHRDLKPSNVMLGDFGETLVLDWGLAKRRGDADRGLESVDLTRDDGRTLDGQVLGTPQYMSPEQLAGRIAEVAERSDVYALGVVLHELLTGRPPFGERSVAALAARQMRAPPPDPAALEPAASAELCAIARRALARDAAERYPDAGALLADLLAFQAGGHVEAHRYTRRERLARFARRHRSALVLAASVLIVAVAAWVWRGQREAERAAAAERARQADVMRAVDAVLDDARHTRTAGWLDLYPSRLVGLKEPVVEDRIIALLDDPDRALRQLAARTLGLMASRRALDPLIARLAPDAERDEAVIIEVIRALGIIGDPRAEPAVFAARARYGNISSVGHDTALAYRMLPPEPPPPDADADAWVDHGRALVEKGRPAEGLAAYDRALARDPRSVRAHNNRGIALRQLGRFAEAIAAFDRALALDPDFVPSLINRSIGLRHRLMLPEAEAPVSRAIALAEADGREDVLNSALRTRAWSRWFAGDLAGARADLDRVVARIGRDRQTVAVESRYWRAAGDLDRALETIDRALALDPAFGLTHQQRARVHLARGALDAAQADIDQAALLDPELADLAADRAMIRRAVGDLAGARAALDAAVDERPGDGRRWIFRAVLAHPPADPAALADADRAVARARPAERVLFALIRSALHLRADRPRPALPAPAGEIPFHDALLPVARGDADPAALAALRHRTTAPEQRCALTLALWLAAGDPSAPWPDPGPLGAPTATQPAADPDPACALIDAR